METATEALVAHKKTEFEIRLDDRKTISEKELTGMGRNELLEIKGVLERHILGITLQLRSVKVRGQLGELEIDQTRYNKMRNAVLVKEYQIRQIDRLLFGLEPTQSMEREFYERKFVKAAKEHLPSELFDRLDREAMGVED